MPTRTDEGLELIMDGHLGVEADGTDLDDLGLVTLLGPQRTGVPAGALEIATDEHGRTHDPEL